MIKARLDAFRKLSDQQREFLRLRLEYELSDAEIARRKGISVARVQAIVSQALRRFRELLGTSQS